LNRVGDSAFIAACGFIFLIFKTLDFNTVFTLTPFIVGLDFQFLGCTLSYLEIISLLLVIGAIGKSAQLGLHGWLPEAMEGPTPVSALIHAATLVTAGIFLIIRCSPLIEYAPFTLNFVLILGGLTCLFGSTVACAQNDLKRIIAFSTTSQLGYMFFACGLSSYNVALFHLFNHGFFKALLFLCAGAIIFSVSHEQDVRKFGNLILFLPFIYSAFVISLLALIGFPFLSGFYSKELIIELAYSSYSINSFYVY
jgi:NADH:ubiquinone oxidoreductase subunit 5 (subunit L)/multisubunit Na+/H+ antiporter MnhA subunit